MRRSETGDGEDGRNGPAGDASHDSHDGTSGSDDGAYCSRCGRALEPAGGGGRPACAGCGFVFHRDPKVAAGVVVARDGERHDEVLLVRRDHEPGYGRWSFPSGFVDRGEPVEQAGVREALEETGVRVRIDRLLGVYSGAGDPVVFIVYAATLIEGEPTAGDEVTEVGFFSPDALPDLAFGHDREIIAAWRSGDETG